MQNLKLEVASAGCRILLQLGGFRVISPIPPGTYYIGPGRMAPILLGEMPWAVHFTPPVAWLYRGFGFRLEA